MSGHFLISLIVEGEDILDETDYPSKGFMALAYQMPASARKSSRRSTGTFRKDKVDFNLNSSVPSPSRSGAPSTSQDDAHDDVLMDDTPLLSK